MPKVNSTLKAADPWLKWLIMAGTVTYFVEITTGISEGNSGHSVFWWVQSFIAVCFTIEYILRWVDDAQDHYQCHAHFCNWSRGLCWDSRCGGCKLL